MLKKIVKKSSWLIGVMVLSVISVFVFLKGGNDANAGSTRGNWDVCTGADNIPDAHCHSGYNRSSDDDDDDDDDDDGENAGDSGGWGSGDGEATGI